ncbi:unnamed protein product [Soboliphyme baturini]|uniref:Uncharacterized protein n=1 Tax=Soboliphyme baturini TaxID=241478 RepID=A0A183ITJ9_9BILA|nr:unnamed protein product [Soboliphyme baturini]
MRCFRALQTSSLANQQQARAVLTGVLTFGYIRRETSSRGEACLLVFDGRRPGCQAFLDDVKPSPLALLAATCSKIGASSGSTGSDTGASSHDVVLDSSGSEPLVSVAAQDNSITTASGGGKDKELIPFDVLQSSTSSSAAVAVSAKVTCAEDKNTFLLPAYQNITVDGQEAIFIPISAPLSVWKVPVFRCCRSQTRLRKEEDWRPWRSPHKISLPALHGIDVIENDTGSVVARVTRNRAGCEKSTIRTCLSPSASRGRSSATTNDEDRRNNDEDTSQQRSRYPF